jgi:hypothetical protein
MGLGAISIEKIDLGSIISGFGGLAKDLRTAIKGYELTPDQQAEIEGKLAELEQSTIQAQSAIVIAEAKGGWLQRNWRPGLMALFGIIIANNYIVHPYVSAFSDKSVMLAIPPDMWSLLKIGVGGYVLGRSAEKGIKTWKGK